MSIEITTSRFHFIGTFWIDQDVDATASAFIPGSASLVLANKTVCKAQDYSRFDSLLIVTQDTTFTAAIAVEVLQHASKDETLDASWSTLQSGGTDVTIAADKAVVIDTALAAPAIRLASAGSEAADRVFYVYGRLPA